ncbi:hypothetical protein EC988_009065, partial [Linderina pennispora]
MAALRLQEQGFLPALQSDAGKKRVLCMPNQCYSNPGCAVMGFAVLEKHWRRESERFGVAMDPLISMCIDKLSNGPPQTHAEATRVFAYMASRQGEITRSELLALTRLSFIPIFDKDGQVARRVRPAECYFKGNSAEYQAAFFSFIEYAGPAGSFLRSCGVRDEPSISDIAVMLAERPENVLQVCGGWEQYLALLRQIAVNADQLLGKKVWKQMQTSKCLVGTREQKGGEEGLAEYSLVAAHQVFLVDDSVLARKFSPFCAPTEDLLETFYASLGA